MKNVLAVVVALALIGLLAYNVEHDGSV